MALEGSLFGGNPASPKNAPEESAYLRALQHVPALWRRILKLGRVQGAT
jgi:hypothetical protein